MLVPKDLLLADVVHAERLHRAEQARLAHQAAADHRRPAGGRWWVRGWRRGRPWPGAHVADLAATRA